jgi:PadR family transcriptional regulator PadR
MARALNLGNLEQLVLMAILQLGERAYGVAIQQEIEARTDREVKLSAIYITLDRLYRKGYISSRLGEKTEERGGRAKRYFRLDGLGEQALRQSRDDVKRMAHGLEPTEEHS